MLSTGVQFLTDCRDGRRVGELFKYEAVPQWTSALGTVGVTRGWVTAQCELPRGQRKTSVTFYIGSVNISGDIRQGSAAQSAETLRAVYAWLYDTAALVYWRTAAGVPCKHSCASHAAKLR